MKMADEHADAAKKHADETKKRLGEERAAREKASKEGAKAAGDVKPTPTQEEADMAASGVYLSEHEDDGSGPDPNVPQTKDAKQAEAGKPKAGYATRASTAG
jgi:sRNA-binding protein